MNRILSVACIIVSCLLISLTQGTDAARDGWLLKTGVDAENAALAHTGFSNLAYSLVPSKPTEVVVLKDDQTPFLHGQINGRQLWRVYVSLQLEIRVENASGDSFQRRDSTPREFVIYMDPKTGNIIKAVSGAEKVYEHKPPMPSADTAEWVLTHRKEIFHGLPTEPPGIDFLEALRYIYGPDPFTAQEIHVWYMKYSRMGTKPQNVWMIDLRGLDPPMPTISHLGSNANIPIEQRNHLRTIVDANKGRHIFSSIGPHGGGVHKMFNPDDLTDSSETEEK